jgi:hypothetical protein
VVRAQTARLLFDAAVLPRFPNESYSDWEKRREIILRAVDQIEQRSTTPLDTARLQTALALLTAENDMPRIHALIDRVIKYVSSIYTTRTLTHTCCDMICVHEIVGRMYPIPCH